ncbi:MAG: class I SAM-dependent methyltransferase [Bacteroidales bacterium]
MNKTISDFSGQTLYGDNLSPEEIQTWFDDETHGFESLEGTVDKCSNEYDFHKFNFLNGFSKLPSSLKFEKVLGLGSAWGYEFEPYIDRMKNITIIEPSDKLVKNKIGNIIPTYVYPNMSGAIDFPDNTFNLITSFAALHHIPNVSFVVSELLRILKPGGYLLLREPITSMGDWRKPRKGLTKHERGIPPKIFEAVFEQSNIQIISKQYSFTGTFALQRILNKFTKIQLHNLKFYLYFDKVVSKLMKWNWNYHPKNIWQRIAPQNVFYVVTKK